MLRWRELLAPLRTSLVVGTVLCLLNGTFAAGPPSRIALNYLVPLLVAAYSRYSLARELAARSRSSSTDH